MLTIPLLCLSFVQYLGVIGGAEKTLDFCVIFCVYTWVYLYIGVLFVLVLFVLVYICTFVFRYLYIGTGVFRVYFNLENFMSFSTFVPFYSSSVFNAELTTRYGYPVFVLQSSCVDGKTVDMNGGAVACITKCEQHHKHIVVTSKSLSLWRDELEAVLLHEKGHLVLNHHVELLSGLVDSDRACELEIEADRYSVLNHSRGVIVGSSYLARVIYDDPSIRSSTIDRRLSILYRFMRSV